MHKVNVRIDEIFQAVSDPLRVRIVRLMAEANSHVCLCEISDSLDEPEYKLSRHIKLLKQAGLISSTREGKWIYHSLVRDRSYIKTILHSVKQFPDEAGEFEKDFARFKKRLKMRQGGRCQTGSSANQKSVVAQVR